MTDVLIMGIKEVQMDYGKIFFWFVRLLASSKVEVSNDMILKTGNTTIKVVYTEN